MPSTFENPRAAQKVGVLLLEVPPDDFPGSLIDPTIFPVPMISETVKGAWVDEMLAVDPGLTRPAIEAAQRLERQGATLLISNCGYFIAYRAAIQPRVSVPAAISSLLWLPHLNALRSPGRKIGIVTFDATKLTRAHLEAAWPGLDPDALAIVGLEGTEMWKNAGKQASTYDYDEIWSDVRAALDRLLATQPTVQFILIECCTLCAFVPLIRRHTGLPAYDIVALARWYLGGLDAGSEGDAAIV
jgi:hypothetical protein